MKTRAGLFTKGMIGAMAMTLLVACGKKDEGAPPPPPPPPVVGPNGGVLGGGMYGGNILNNVQFQTDHMQGVLSITGTMGNMDMSNPFVGVYYVGPVTFSGTVTILDNTYCGAPSQSYPLVGTANYNVGAMSGINVTAGPLQLFGNRAVVTNPVEISRDIPGTRIAFLNSQLVVNGQPCGYLTTF